MDSISKLLFHWYVLSREAILYSTGFFAIDAGQTFTLYALAWGALTHGEGYRLGQQTAYLDATLRWGFDWLIKVSRTSSTRYRVLCDLVEASFC